MVAPPAKFMHHCVRLEGEAWPFERPTARFPERLFGVDVVNMKLCSNLSSITS